MSVDPYLVAQAERIGELTTKRARKRRRPRRQPQSQPQIHITVNVPSAAAAEPSRSPRRRKGSVRPGRVGDYIANDRSRIRRIGPSPG